MREARSQAMLRRPVATCAKGAAPEVEVLDSAGTLLAEVEAGNSLEGPSVVAVEIGAVEVTVTEEKPLLMGASYVEDAMVSNDADADDDAEAEMSVGDEDAKSEVVLDST
jgi:hypothetical protein